MPKRLAAAVAMGVVLASTSWATATEAHAVSSGWSIVPSPNPPGSTDAELSAVSCARADSCIAVGDYQTSNGDRALAEKWNGLQWSIQQTPDAAGAFDDILQGVSCTGPRWCAAVGYSFTKRSAERALVEVWNGTTWTVAPTPLPGKGGAGLSGVSCTYRRFCMAVGGFSRAGVNAQDEPLTERWNGSAWSVLFTPNPHAENGSFLSAVSCPAADACTAGGDYAYGDVAQSIFAMRWNGSRWTDQRQPNPTGQSFNTQSAVSCTTVSSCTSAGSWTNGGEQSLTLTESWNGVRWTRQRSPNPHGFESASLSGLACSSAVCTAVGDSTKSSTGIPTVSLALHFNGTSWGLQPTPNPAGSRVAGLDGVDCSASQNDCVAVGSFWNGSITQTLVERFRA